MKKIYDKTILPILTILFLTSKKYILNTIPNKEYISYKIKNEFTLFTFLILSLITSVFIYLKYFKMIKKKNPIYDYLKINSKLSKNEIERRMSLNQKKKEDWENDKNNKLKKFNFEIEKFINPILINFLFDFFLMIFCRIFIFEFYLNYICVKSIGIFNFWKLLRISFLLKAEKFWHKFCIVFLIFLSICKFSTNVVEALIFYEFGIWGFLTFLAVIIICGCLSFLERFLVFKQICYTLKILFTKN